MGGAPGVGRFGELIRRTLLTRGFTGGEVLDDYFPMLDLLADKPELLRLRGENSFGVAARAAGGAGLVARVWCMNKKAGQLAVITHTILGVGANPMQVWGAVTNANLPADATFSGGFDSRNSGLTGSPSAAVSAAADTAGGPATGPFLIQMAANTALVIPTRIVLSPGFAFIVSGDTPGVGQDLRATFLGYERNAESAELT